MIYIMAIFGYILGGVVYFSLFKNKKYKINCKLKYLYAFFYIYLSLINAYTCTLLMNCFDDLKISILFMILHTIFIYMIIIDIKYKAIPTICLLYTLIIGIGICLYQDELLLYERMIALCIGIIPLAFLSFIFKSSIGNGDILFLGILGFIMGIEGIVLILIFSYCMASIYIFIMWIRKKAHKKMQIAMFPFFYMSFMFYLLCPTLIHQYIHIWMV